MDAFRKTIASLADVGNYVKTKRRDFAHFKWSEFANVFGWSPLMSAAYHGSIATVKLLLDRGCPLGGATWARHNALMVGALRGHDGVVGLLAERGALDEDRPDVLGYTTLHFACGACSLETVRLLVTLGANVNTVSLFGATPFSIAEASGRIEIEEYLRNLCALEGGQDADAKFNLMRSAIRGEFFRSEDGPEHQMSFQTVLTEEERRSILVDGVIVKYLGWTPRSDYETLVHSDLTALEDAFNTLKEGGTADEVYAPLRYSIARHMMPYLIFRKGTVDKQPPLYLDTASYSEYLVRIFGLLEAGIDCRAWGIVSPQV